MVDEVTEGSLFHLATARKKPFEKELRKNHCLFLVLTHRKSDRGPHRDSDLRRIRRRWAEPVAPHIRYIVIT